MRNGFTIIDAHCHIYPEKIAIKASHSTDTFYNTRAAHLGTVADMLAVGKSAGIDKFIIESVATTPKQVGSINAYIASEAEKPEFVGLGTLHHESANQAEDVENVVRLGLHGIKMHPDIQRVAVDDDRMKEIYGLLGEAHLPILLHTGDNRYDFSNPNRLIPVLKAFPHVTFIGAHFGGWSIWEEASELLYMFDNFFVDCSSSFNYVNNEKAKHMFSLYGSDKVMFGTDYPMWDPETELGRFFDIPFSDGERKKILSENAKRIYGIQ